MGGNLQFSGNAQIYLEGKRALQPIEWQDARKMSYFLGDSGSRIRIIDNRMSANTEALAAMAGNLAHHFADVFSELAWVMVELGNDGIEINIEDRQESSSEDRILWMGVVDGNEIPANPVSWLQFQETEDSRIAFVGLIENVRTID